MRWGMPPQDLTQSSWQVRDLRNKSEKVFKAYSSLFMRHLCEPVVDNSDSFMDGVPREGLNRQAVLSRIGLMSILRKKVQEFEKFNGEWSMPETREKMLATAAQASVSNLPGMIKIKEEPIDIDETPMDVDQSNITKTEELASEVKVEEEPKAPRLPYKFNICDGGYTELHSLWINEEKVARNGKEYEIWHRRHDFWLLAAVAVYGYGRYQINFQDIMNDPKFSIVNEPFKQTGADPATNFADVKNKFLARRFKLLEQSLVIEEQLRRAAHINKQQSPDQVGQLAQHFSELEHTADAHVNIARESNNGNRNANAILHKCLAQLDDLLSDLKTDVARLPATISQVRPVTERLQMSERQILSRLVVAKDPDAAPSKPALPPSGPFITPLFNQNFTTIQPKFPSLFDCNLSPDDEPIDIEGSISAAVAEASRASSIAATKDEPMDTSDKDIPSTSAAAGSSYPRY